MVTTWYPCWFYKEYRNNWYRMIKAQIDNQRRERGPNGNLRVADVESELLLGRAAMPKAPKGAEEVSTDCWVSILTFGVKDVFLCVASFYFEAFSANAQTFPRILHHKDFYKVTDWSELHDDDSTSPSCTHIIITQYYSVRTSLHITVCHGTDGNHTVNLVYFFSPVVRLKCTFKGADIIPCFLHRSVLSSRSSHQRFSRTI